MKITLKTPSLYNELFMKKNRDNVANVMDEYFFSYIDYINNLLDVDIDKMSDEKLYFLISKFYDVDVDDWDLVNILASTNGEDYNTLKLMATNMVNYIKQSVSNMFIRTARCYVIVCNEDFDTSIVYTKDHVEELVNDKKIVLLHEKLMFVKKLITSKDFPEEKFEIPDYSEECKNKDSKYFYAFASLLRNNINKIQIISDLKLYLINLHQQYLYAYFNRSNDYNSNISNNVIKSVKNNKENIDKYIKLLKRNNI